MRASTVLIAALALTMAGGAAAAPGDLDPSFSGDGKLIISVGSGADVAAGMVLQPDGKIVVAGTCNGTTINFCLTRHRSNGTADHLFGPNGVGSSHNFNLSGGDDTLTGIALAPGGKIVVAGYCLHDGKYDFCVARLDTDGSLDTTFSGDGKVITAVSADANLARAVAVQPDGKIVVAGDCGPSGNRNFCVVRYTVTGALDVSFAGNGKLATNIHQNDVPSAVAIQSDGKIVVSGTCAVDSFAGSREFCVARYSPTGAIDAGFPRTRSIANAGDVAEALVLQPDGKLIIVGYCDDINFTKFCLIRYNADGSSDLTFDYTQSPETGSIAQAATIQADGKIVVAGYCTSGGNSDFCVALYNSDGTLDKSFATGGLRTVAIGADNDLPSAVAVQPDGKIVVAGRCQSGSNYQFCVARFEAPAQGYRACSLDLDGDGRVLATTDMLIATRVALGVTGNAVLAGITFGSAATRTTWGDDTASDIRRWLSTQCGLQTAG